MSSRLIFPCWTVLLAFLLVGCGFQLRGADTVPNLTASYAVQVNSPFPHLNHQFEIQLIRLGFKVVNSDPQYLIQLHNQEYDEYEFGVNTEFSEVFKRVNYRLNYAVFDSDGTPVIGRQTFEISTDYFNPSGNYLQQTVARNNALDHLRKKSAVMIANRLVAEVATPATVNE